MTLEQRFHFSELRKEACAPFVQSRLRRKVRRAPPDARAINRGVDFEAFNESYLERLTSGDNTTEQHFVSYFGRLIRMKLRSRVRSQELIDDICQETFLRVLSKLRNKGGVEHPERFGAFVNTVCDYVMLERFRAQARTDPFPYAGFDTADPNANTESGLVSDEQRELWSWFSAVCPQIIANCSG